MEEFIKMIISWESNYINSFDILGDKTTRKRIKSYIQSGHCISLYMYLTMISLDHKRQKWIFYEFYSHKVVIKWTCLVE